MCDSRGVVIEWLFVSDPQRICWIEVFHMAVFHKDLGDTVIGRWQEETMIEADIERTGPQFAVPVRCGITEAEVPFADRRGGVSRPFQDRGEGLGPGLDDGRTVRRCNPGSFLPKGIRAGEQ